MLYASGNAWTPARFWTYYKVRTLQDREEALALGYVPVTWAVDPKSVPNWPGLRPDKTAPLVQAPQYTRRGQPDGQTRGGDLLDLKTVQDHPLTGRQYHQAPKPDKTKREDKTPDKP